MKTLSISDLLQAGVNANVGVWIINSAKNSELGLNGDLYLQVPKLNGSKSDPLKIEQTWLAQDLTRKIPRAQLIEASEFRNLVETQLITLITEEHAKRINGRDGADLERRRLQTTRLQPKTLEAARRVSIKAEISRADGTKDDADDDMKVDIVGPDGRKQELHDAAEIAAAAAHGLDLDDDGMTATFVMFSAKLQREADAQALNAIRTYGKISSKELRYLKRRLTKHPITSKAITAQLAQRKATRLKKLARAA